MAEIIILLYALSVITLITYHIVENKYVLLLCYIIMIQGLRNVQIIIFNYFERSTEYAFWMPLLNMHILPFVMMCGPFLYLYLKSIELNKVPWKNTYFLFLLLPILITIDIFPYLQLDFTQKIEIQTRLVSNQNDLNKYHLFLKDSISKLIVHLHTALYIICVFFNYYRNKNPQNTTIKKNITFLRYILIIFIINWSPYFLVIINSYLNMNHGTDFLYKNQFYPPKILIILFSAATPMTLFILPSFTFNKKFPQPIFILKYFKLEAKFNNQKKEDLNDEILKSIELHMEQKKPFLDQNFSISMLSSEIGISPSTISSTIKSELNVSFPKFKNQYRLSYCLELFKNGSFDNFTIDAIAYEAGFKNKSTFYNSFKKEMKMNPADWIKKHKDY